MVNKVQFEGINKGIVFENKQTVKFILENKGSKKVKKAMITCFKEEYFNMIKESKEKIILIDGEFYESNYQDKKTGNWVNTYCINMNRLIAL